MKRLFRFTAALALVSCTGGDGSTIYFTSFESESDVRPWNGVSVEMLVKHAAPDGGNQSLRIGGGCIQPAATLPLQVHEDGFYKLSCWARMVENNSAGLIIRRDPMDMEPLASVNIEGAEWNYLESNDTFFASAGERLLLEIYCGGIVLAEAEIDLLKIEKVD